MSEPSPTHKHVASLLVAAKQLLDQAQVDPSIDTQISFYAIRTQVDTALSTVLDPQHHGLMDLRQMLSIPTLDVMIRIVGLLQGVVNDYEAGVLKEFPPMPIWGPRFG